MSARSCEQPAGWQRRNSLHADAHAYCSETDHGKQAVAEHTRRPVRVDASDRHEVQKGVHENCSKDGDGVDVRELGLSRLREFRYARRVSQERRLDRTLSTKRETYEKENHSKAEAEEDRTCEVCIVHDALVRLREGVEDGERLGEDV